MLIHYGFDSVSRIRNQQYTAGLRVSMFRSLLSSPFDGLIQLLLTSSLSFRFIRFVSLFLFAWIWFLLNRKQFI